MKTTKRAARDGLLAALMACGLVPSAYAQGPERIVIDPNFPGAYQVEVADVNGDKKPDIVAVGGSTCAWYENPTWKKRIVTDGRQTPGIISSATADIDGDGTAEIAIAYEFEMNVPTTGKLLLAVRGSQGDEPWKLTSIADVPSIHRLRWGDVTGDGKLDLVVAPIFGRDARPPRFEWPAKMIAFSRDDRGHWARFALADRPTIHAIEVQKPTRVGGSSTVLTADNLGASAVELSASNGPSFTYFARSLVVGQLGDAPRRGCSEVHLGALRDGRRFLTTLEPWHGSQVVVYPEVEPELRKFGPRTIIDDTLSEGHALWVADIDGDGDQEIFAGHRGKDHRVAMYDFQRDTATWKKTVIDREIAAQDLRGGNLDGDGVPDVVAAGGSTHNVVWYRFQRK